MDVEHDEMAARPPIPAVLTLKVGLDARLMRAPAPVPGE